MDQGQGNGARRGGKRGGGVNLVNKEVHRLCGKG